MTYVRTIGLFFVFLAAWLLWSGTYKPLLLAFGLISCLLTFYFARRIDFFDREVFAFHLWPRLPGYWAWLLKEITKSSLDVARIVIHPKLPISPTVVEFDTAPPGPVGQAILGNAITLTPGSVTLDRKFNYRALWSKLDAEFDIVTAYAYAIDRGDPQQQKFQGALGHIGFEVKLKPWIQRADGSAKGDWDVGITIDVLEEARHLDAVILLSGDGDHADPFTNEQGDLVFCRDAETGAEYDSTNGDRWSKKYNQVGAVLQ